MTVLLPSAELQFADANGHPYAGGTLETYITGTTTPKTTWIDPGGIGTNTQPIRLDSAGRCILYGDGAYRLILRDANGVLVWDQPSSTLVSVAMAPVCLAPTIAAAQVLLGIDPTLAADIAAEATARAAGDAVNAAAIAAEITARNAAIAVEAARALAAEGVTNTNLANAETTLLAAIAALGIGGAGPVSVRTGTGTADSLGYASVAFSPVFPARRLTITAIGTGMYNGFNFQSWDSPLSWPSNATTSFSLMTLGDTPNPVPFATFEWQATGF